RGRRFPDGDRRGRSGNRWTGRVRPPRSRAPSLARDSGRRRGGRMRRLPSRDERLTRRARATTPGACLAVLASVGGDMLRDPAPCNRRSVRGADHIVRGPGSDASHLRDGPPMAFPRRGTPGDGMQSGGQTADGNELAGSRAVKGEAMHPRMDGARSSCRFVALPLAFLAVVSTSMPAGAAWDGTQAIVPGDHVSARFAAPPQTETHFFTFYAPDGTKLNLSWKTDKGEKLAVTVLDPELQPINIASHLKGHKIKRLPLPTHGRHTIQVQTTAG